jgi:hypothetical protein
MVKAYSVIALQAGEFEEQTRQLDDEALKAEMLADIHESCQIVVRFQYTVLNRVPDIYINMRNGGTT